jgi:hypothetical protein
LLLALVGMYYIGKQMGEKGMKIALTQNYETIRQIAELAALETTGVNEIKLTNAAADGGLFASMQNLFFENTLQVRIPYTAKYGVDLQATKLEIKRTDSAILIMLPEVKLLSYELHLDRAETFGKTGWLQSQDVNSLKTAESTLYAQSKVQLATNTQMIAAAQANLAKIMTGYFAPLGWRVQIYYNGQRYRVAALAS